jgi:phage/plasmid primase-like uncharacterized protein
MDQKIFLEYLQDYTLKALSVADDDVSQAADYLEKLSKPSIFSKHRKEKRAALERAQKVFQNSRGRSVYLVLKSLGFDDLARQKL